MRTLKQVWCYWQHRIWCHWEKSGDFEELRCSHCMHTIIWKYSSRRQ